MYSSLSHQRSNKFSSWNWHLFMVLTFDSKNFLCLSEKELLCNNDKTKKYIDICNVICTWPFMHHILFFNKNKNQLNTWVSIQIVAFHLRRYFIRSYGPYVSYNIVRYLYLIMLFWFYVLRGGNFVHLCM